MTERGKPAGALSPVGLIAAMPEPVLLVSADRRIEAANPAAQSIFGTGLAGAPVVLCLRQPEAVSVLEQGFRALSDPDAPQGPFEAARLATGPLGDRTWRLTVSPVEAHTPAARLVVALRDVSHLEEAEQQRRDFVANVSHEMRSPLTVLSGFIETLRGPARDDPVAQERFLGIMEAEAQRMARLVADLLTLSKVESDERIRPRAPVSVAEVLRATLAALRPQIEAAGIAVDLDLAAAEAPVPGDRDQLVQVFHNLIENAVKYGAGGGRIAVRCDRPAAGGGLSGPALRIAVTDHGEGIDPVHLPRLTERFYRIDGHRSRQMGGTGLGLAIVKHIVNRHRGRLSIRSARGEGSTFTVVLPAG
jgi:two-component system, OmpR family, phosphate regulon sensor histidine kinase PhoR